MLKNQENSRKQGDVGLGAAIAWFTKKGYTTCVPLTDSQKYDLVVDMGKGLKRVQVKTTFFKKRSGHYVVTTKTCGGNRSGNKTHYFDNVNSDYLFAFTEEGSMYLIPSRVVPKSEMTLNATRDKYRLN